MHTQGCNAYEAMEHLALGKAITLKPFSFQRKAHIEQRRGNYLRSIRKIMHAVAIPYLHYVHYEVEGREHRHLLSQSRSKIRSLG